MENTTSKPLSSMDQAFCVTFWVIAVVSFVLNLLFAVVLARKPSMLKRPHNILLFSLAVVDMLTGVFLVATPGYAIPTSKYPVPLGLRGQIFCRLLANRYLLFALGKVSILLVACLAFERWYCVLRPFKYKHQFKRKRTIVYVFIAFMITCILSMNKLFETSLDGSKCVTDKAPFGIDGTRAFVIVYSFVAFYIPCLLTWLTFGHIKLNLPSSPGESAENVNKRRRMDMLLRMCAVTAAAMTVCGFPSQTNYILSFFGLTEVKSPLHKAFNVLVFVNSCMNPLIYCLTNKDYRREFKKLLGCHRGNEISPETDHGTTLA
ncbi:beta-4C adrenergic receptor-like [Stylophora pistillata]|uniref:beta-4C adrenergic receptor-like n=1 Tax=Stylophora pistillata TaxID=50429 RepID=UPI000C0441A0|nr:beta-4C adrenergic receptor-like [Stylophora pistillata]XP_022786138.1 beta-4C adrenergic receptor-like [Stylophora pistillata]XP_022786139.1 beta-4C adrenergic receptor-like [Stylophora pistillata]XP_022786140.1 beta-4C adrenergic receptor-like [Stylophora pistillata]XP_022786142.1 beta-4C adrenergic receptor-like [Stylophora pistillata]XP_022786143.1 beta-4C adrenergic receptor-like [Stylophora pistillata]XP_022786144.1 beta-4C adrenergic receptor-like [Stylophora pistillata]